MKIIIWLILLFIGVYQFSFGQQPELVVQTGHSDSVNSVAFSPNGKILASGGEDNKIKLCNVETGQELRSLEGHTNSVESVIFSPDGKTLASGSIDSSIKLWNVETGQLLKSLSSGNETILSVAFSPDGLTLASGSGGLGILKLWDVETGRLLKTLEVNSYSTDTTLFLSTVSSVAFSPDGKILASGNQDKTIKLWNVETGQKLRTFEGHTGSVQSIVFSPDGKTLASSGHENTIKLWNIETGKEIKSLKGHTSFVSSVAFSPDGRTLASGSWDKTVKLWDIESGLIRISLDNFSSYIYSIAFSPNGKTLASGENDSSIKIWNVTTGQMLKSMKNYVKSVKSVAFSPDGKILASGGNDGFIKLWDIESGQLLKSLEIPAQSVNSVAFSPNGKILALGSEDNKIKLWNVETGQELKSLEGHIDSITSIAFSPDGKILASGGSDGIIELWNVKNRHLLKTLKVNAPIVWSITFSPDGKTLASGGESIFVKLWDVETGQELKSFNYYSLVKSVAFSPDGKTLVAAGSKKTIRLWDVETGKELKPLEGQSDWIWSVAFSPNGKTLVSGSRDNKIRLWNVETGKLIKIFESHAGSIWSLKFLPDGRFIVSGSQDATMKLWDIGKNKLLATLISIDKNDWLVTTPEGFFDGTPTAWKQLIWRFNNNTFDYAPVETYFNDFFYPNLLQDVLAGKSPKPPAGSELEKKDRRQPKVEIASVNGLTRAQMNTQIANHPATDKRSVAVTIEVTDNTDKPKQPTHKPTSEVQDLRLFRNGSLVKIWHGETVDDIFKQNKSDCEVKPAVSNAGRKLVCRTSVPIVAGDNNFTAYAFNADNVKSNDDTVLIKGADSLKRDGTLYVLAVGVNKYANSAYNLNFAVPDVEEIGAAVKTQQDRLAQDRQLKQYGKTEIISLTDETATKENILLALRRFSEGEKANIPTGASEKLKSELTKIRPAQPEDALVIYYAGHGTSNGQRFYLLPHNFTGAGGVKSLDEQGVSDIELNEVLEKVDAGRLLMAIDACQSGQALGAQNEGRGPMNSKGLAQLAYDKGMLILTAAQSQQAALEAVNIGGKEINHGLLTYALLQGLTDSRADKDNNKQLWEREWLDYAVEQVPQLQLEAMKQRHIEIEKNKRGVEIIYVNGDKQNTNPADRKVQTPRVFYRRETEINPLVVAKP